MSIPALSTAAFTQYVSASSNISASQQAFQSLQQGLAAGNLAAAQLAFATYQSLDQNLAKAGTSQSSQLTSDLSTLGSALDDGDLTASRTAFAAVQSDLKSTPSQAITAAENAAAQTVNEINQLLNSLPSSNSSSSASSDPITSLLNSVFGGKSSSSADQTIAILQSHYGSAGTDVGTSSIIASEAGVNVYA